MKYNTYFNENNVVSWKIMRIKIRSLLKRSRRRKYKIYTSKVSIETDFSIELSLSKQRNSFQYQKFLLITQKKE